MKLLDMFDRPRNQGDHHTISGRGILFIKRFSDTQCRRIITVEYAPPCDLLIPAATGISQQLHQRIVESNSAWQAVGSQHDLRKHWLSLMDSGVSVDNQLKSFICFMSPGGHCRQVTLCSLPSFLRADFLPGIKEAG
ncbi:hypothetical protein H8J52_12380 [Klebsiella pneumoniae]|nr:hypothetical protein [Klebsiella pneumoniae]MBH2998828.1 hypothetical protein [Serratia marcescens]HDT5650913.1 hypothetical protein [Klebsiella pneumoniae subsp. pneumoniae]MBC5358485.1 hypothetical protein [Klebsiella pneumoniae]HCR5421257.1 hypothetical protein [Klebsiella pneumoniae]